MKDSVIALLRIREKTPSSCEYVELLKASSEEITIRFVGGNNEVTERNIWKGIDYKVDDEWIDLGPIAEPFVTPLLSINSEGDLVVKQSITVFGAVIPGLIPSVHSATKWGRFERTQYEEGR